MVSRVINVVPNLGKKLKGFSEIGKFGNLTKIDQNHGKSKVFKLPDTLSPSSSNIFGQDKILACVVGPQFAGKSSLEAIGALHKNWRKKNLYLPPHEGSQITILINYYGHKR